MNGGTLGLLLLSAVAAACGQVLFKLGASGQTTLAGFLNGWNCAGAIAYAFGTALWIYALSKAPLTAVYPFTALTFVFVFVAGAYFFDEAVSVAAISGVLLILLGLFLTTR